MMVEEDSRNNFCRRCREASSAEWSTEKIPSEEGNNDRLLNMFTFQEKTSTRGEFGIN